MGTNLQDLFAPARGAVFETWQIGVGRMPVWVFPPEGRPLRPLFALYCNVDREEVGLVLGDEKGEPESALVKRALLSAIGDWRSKPLRIEVSEPRLLFILTDLLAETDVSVGIGSHLALLRAAEREILTKFSEKETSPPGLLSGDVTVAQITAFVRAAGDFLAASPWRLFGAQDLLHVEAPEDVDPRLRWVSVGKSRDRILLTFFLSEEDWEAQIQGGFDADDEEDIRWLLPLISRWELSENDTDLWDRYDLPVHGDNDLCPVPACLHGGEVLRPDSRRLAFFEGLLRTLAASTEQDVDTGRWERHVATHLGPRHFILSFPGLLELREEMTGLDEEVADLLDEAQEWSGRRAVLLARQVLSLQPDNADAWLELANATPDSAQALELYRRALDLMEKRLDDLDGTSIEDEDDLVDDSLPLLRVHAGIATALSDLGRREEAVAHLFEVYRLDPGDLMSYQDRLTCLLIELGRDSEALALLTGNEGLGGPAYTLALIAFRREGDSPAARRALRVAYRNNAQIPSALLPCSLPDPPDPSPLSMDSIDAADYAEAALSAWRATPGALTWLAERSEDLGIADRTSFVRKGKKPRGQKKKKKKRR